MPKPLVSFLLLSAEFVAGGASCVLISHLLGEVLQNSDRIVVMRDGKVVTLGMPRLSIATSLSRPWAVPVGTTKLPSKLDRSSAAAHQFVCVPSPSRQRDGSELIAHEGEIIGLAGLSGHGQTQLLLAIFEAASHGTMAITVTAPVALVAGDRLSDGIFPLWSIAKNIGIRSLGRLSNGLLISSEREDELARTWRTKINIRTPDIHENILSLSGGNQQKALFARALGSDAKIVLMDDPMRGVDYGTKLEVYDLIRKEARSGAPSSGTRPKLKNWKTAIMYMFSATGASSLISVAAS